MESQLACNCVSGRCLCLTKNFFSCIPGRSLTEGLLYRRDLSLDRWGGNAPLNRMTFYALTSIVFPIHTDIGGVACQTSYLNGTIVPTTYESSWYHHACWE
jgi:hypothetical protein